MALNSHREPSGTNVEQKRQSSRGRGIQDEPRRSENSPWQSRGGRAIKKNGPARRHLVWRGRGGSSKLPLESIRRLNEAPRRCELIVIRRYSPPCTTARRGGGVIKENMAKPPKQTQPGWFSF